MEVIKLETSDYEQPLRDRLEFEIEVLRQEGLKIKFEEYRYNQRTVFIFKLSCEEEKMLMIIKEYIANAVSDVIINRFEENQLNYILQTNYGEFSTEEREEILQFAYKRLNFEEKISSEISMVLRRKNQIAERIYDYLTKENKINLEGFTEFRLKEYKASLQLAVEEAVDEYLIEQEYQEFVGLLEDIIGEEDRKQDIVNVVKTQDNNFRLIDKNGVEIKSSWLNDNEIDNLAIIKTEDKLISGLINIAPEKVILHFNNPNSVIEILKNIFEDDLSICLGCKYCRTNEFKQ